MDEFDIDWPREDKSNYAFYSDVFSLVLERRGPGTRAMLKERAGKLIPKTKTQEKLAFTFGVYMIWICAFIIGRFPEYMNIWYISHAGLLLSVRWVTYKRQSLHYFCFDLCYFVNVLTMWWLFIAPQTQPLYMAVFCLSQGPVLWAILAWRNSLVFHSLDKLTSLFIHIAPSLTVYALRWFPKENEITEQLTHLTNPLGTQETMSFLPSLIYSLSFYVLWQLLYVIGIAYVKHDKIEKGLRTTSYSWLLDPQKNQKGKNLMYLLCTVPSQSDGNSKLQHLKQQVLFVFWQFMYALLTLMPTCFMYSSFYFHTAVIMLILTVSIWNGASYYVEVFSRPKSTNSHNDTQAKGNKDKDTKKDESVEAQELKKE